MAALPNPRIAAFSPGLSPPAVRSPTRLGLAIVRAWEPLEAGASCTRRNGSREFVGPSDGSIGEDAASRPAVHQTLTSVRDLAEDHPFGRSRRCRIGSRIIRKPLARPSRPAMSGTSSAACSASGRASVLIADDLGRDVRRLVGDEQPSAACSTSAGRRLRGRWRPASSGPAGCTVLASTIAVNVKASVASMIAAGEARGRTTGRTSRRPSSRPAASLMRSSAIGDRV